MSTDDLIAALQGDMRVDSEGSFTLHREKAREKLRTFQVAEPQKYILHLIALATLKRATAVHVRCDSDDVVVRFDGEPVTAQDLDDLYGSSFAAARTDVQRARQQLAVAIHAAMALNPRHVRVCSGTGAAAVSMTVRHGAADEIGGAMKGAPPGTEIQVKQRFRPGLMVRFVNQLRGALAEMTWLRERCEFSTLPIFLNGVQISAGLRIADAGHMFRHDGAATQGVAGLARRPLPAIVRLVRHGVWLHDVPAPHLPLGFTAVIRDDRLLTDLSGDKVVQDEHHAGCVKVAETLAAAVLGAAIGAKEGPVTPALAQRILPVWQHWPAALQRDTAIGAVMGRIVRWPDIFRRVHSLAALHAVHQRLGHVPVAWGEWHEKVPVADDIVVQRVESVPRGFDDALIERAFGTAMYDVTGELERRALAEQQRRRWRAQPCESTLSPAQYHLTAPFEVTLAGVKVEGHVGLRRTPATVCALKVVVDGFLLAELELPTPIAGIDVLLAGPLPIRDDFTGPVTGDLLAACLGGWVAAARVLAETALRRGLVPEEEEPRRAFVHGFLRSYHRGEVLRSLLVATGFEQATHVDHIRHLLRAMPPHPVPEDLHEQPWLRGMYAFTMASGEVLEAAAVGRLLAEGVALKYVDATVEAHANVDEPVLRVGQREAEALRWLFAAKVPRMKAEDYAVVLARARFLEKPEVTGVLSEETCTPHVVVEHEQLRICVAFVLAADPANATRRYSNCELIVRRRRLGRVSFNAPIDRLNFAVIGEGLAIKRTWDGVDIDGKFLEVERAAALAVPTLVRAAIEALPEESDAEVRAAYRAGILAALTATFPTPGWRTAFATLIVAHGRGEAERRYMRLFGLTQTTPAAEFNAWIDKHQHDPKRLGDVDAVAAEFKVQPRTPLRIEAITAQLAALRKALGQVSKGSWLEDVGRCSPAVASLPLLARADGESVTLAQVAAQMEGLAIHIVVDREDCAWPHTGRARKLADEPTSAVLRSLFGHAELRVPELSEAPTLSGSPEDLLGVMRELRRRMTAHKAAAAALPGLIAAAIAGARRADDEGAQWRKGLVLALGATFPAPVLRRLYVFLQTLHGAGAEDLYCTALLRAQRVGVDGLAMELEEKLAVPPKTHRGDARVAGLRDLLMRLRQALGQVEGATLADAVGNHNAAMGALALFQRIDGTAVTLAEVAAEAKAGMLYVFAGADVHERPRAYLRSLRVDEDTLDTLRGMFGAERVSTTAPPRPEGEEVKRDAPGRSAKGLEDAPAPATSPEWLTMLKLAQKDSGSPIPAKLPTRSDAEDVARLHGELRALSGPSKAASATTFDPPKPREPTPTERMVAAIQSELHALRRGHEALLTGFNLDHVRAAPGDGKQAVRCDRNGVVLDANHPRIAAAVAGYGRDRVWVSFLVSQVYTALNVWREDITDEDEEAFHRRHLEWLRGELVRDG